jgi:hypothetical protein
MKIKANIWKTKNLLLPHPWQAKKDKNQSKGHIN